MKRPVAPTPRDAALAALRGIETVIASPQPIDGLLRATLAAQLAYAIAQVEAIEEVKRARKRARIQVIQVVE